MLHQSVNSAYLASPSDKIVAKDNYSFCISQTSLQVSMFKKEERNLEIGL